MTTPIDVMMPRSCILKFPDQVDFRRPTPTKGSLQVPAGITMVQILWNGDARLIVSAEKSIGGTLVNAWTGNLPAPASGEYPYFRIISSVPTSLAIQGYIISAADLQREMAVSLIPISA